MSFITTSNVVVSIKRGHAIRRKRRYAHVVARCVAILRACIKVIAYRLRAEYDACVRLAQWFTTSRREDIAQWLAVPTEASIRAMQEQFREYHNDVCPSILALPVTLEVIITGRHMDARIVGLESLARTWDAPYRDGIIVLAGAPYRQVDGWTLSDDGASCATHLSSWRQRSSRRFVRDIAGNRSFYKNGIPLHIVGVGECVACFRLIVRGAYNTKHATPRLRLVS